MPRHILAAPAVAVAAALAVQAPALAEGSGAAALGDEADQVIVIDAPDVQKLNAQSVPGFRTSDVVGTDVYSNAGKRIGEVEDFIMSGSGYFYAIVDIQDGAIEQYVDLTDDELVVIPWDQLRVSTRGQQAAR